MLLRPVSKHARTADPEDREALPAADAVTSGQWCSLAFARAKSLSEPCALTAPTPATGTEPGVFNQFRFSGESEAEAFRALA